MKEWLKIAFGSIVLYGILIPVAWVYSWYQGRRKDMTRVETGQPGDVWMSQKRYQRLMKKNPRMGKW